MNGSRRLWNSVRLEDLGLSAYLLLIYFYLAWPATHHLADEFSAILLASETVATGALLFLTFTRASPVHEDSRAPVILLSLSGPLIFTLFELEDIPCWALLATAMTYLFALVSLIRLGRFFSVAPAARGVVSRWPYRWVRHPAYSSYSIYCIIVCLSNPSTRNFGVAMLGCASFYARALLEERTLRRLPAYQDYCKKVPYRMLPWIF
jgi:protein-S-isoprenylcysteine O-methyltransferase Ste14